MVLFSVWPLCARFCFLLLLLLDPLLYLVKRWKKFCKTYHLKDKERERECVCELKFNILLLERRVRTAKTRAVLMKLDSLSAHAYSWIYFSLRSSLIILYLFLPFLLLWGPKPSLKIGSVTKAFLFWYWQRLKKRIF